MKAAELQSEEETQANLGQNLSQITAALNSANQQQNENVQVSLINDFNELDALYKRHEVLLREKRSQMLIDIMEIIGEAVEASLRFDELSAPLNCLTRKELGFPIDQEKYLELLEKSALRQRTLAEKWKKAGCSSCRPTRAAARLSG